MGCRCRVARLPNRHRALVARRKLTHYLLSGTHPAGQHKARWLQRYGFERGEAGRLEAALRSHASRCDVRHTHKSPLGTRYVIEGPLVAPDGRSPWVRAIWFVRSGEVVPRFVTVYPLKGGSR